MVDLHIHTKHSDGTDDVKSILKKAQKLNLEYISITDHDNCTAYEELKKIDVLKYYNGKIVPGIEIKCNLNGRLIDILGYNIDTDKMQKWVDKYYMNNTKEQLQQKYFDILYNICIEQKLVISEKKDIKFDPKKDWASVVIFYELKNYDDNISKLPNDFFESFTNFSKKYCSDKKGIWYIDKSQDYPNIEEVSSAIKNCGGLVFLAHVHIYRWIENIEEHIKFLVNTIGLDGLECFHSEFTEQQIRKSCEFAKKYNLYISGGSDFHGENKKNIKLAYGRDNINIEKKYIGNWI